MRSEKAPRAPFDPGFTWILLNATAWRKEGDSELARLLRFMDRGEAGSGLCRMIDSVLEEAHGDGIWVEGAHEMMTVEQRIEWAEAVGEDRGIEKGIEKLNAMMRWLSESGRTDELTRSLSDSTLRQRLLDEFSQAKGIGK